METKTLNRSNTMPRELGRRGAAGSFIASFGLMWTLSYFVVLSWITSLLVDSYSYFWAFTAAFEWQLLSGGAFLVLFGSVLMLSDWKRREPALPTVTEQPRTAPGYEATHPSMEYQVEA